ncbi:MAG: cell division protein FtsA [Candidatus Binatia bacterium]|nr:cell division protein FtsA [Candidatus Binatia bacterium]MDG2011703.1 cell division protein FtsA [Candidatus Binatia bacterium]HAC81145.1 cell division protein FtsA [Deltaproteobacteria bacterium]
MSRKQPIHVALDIGTHQVSVLVASVEEAAPRIIGVGTSPSRGLRRGVVVDIEATVQAIQRAVREAEMMADCEIHTVVVSLSGSHIQGVSSHGMVPMKSREVSREDVDLVLEAARTIKLPLDREVLHVLSQGYTVDDQAGIRDPEGMAGVRLESRVYVLTASTPIVQNIQKCCNRAGLVVSHVVLAPLASAAAVLGEEERELGVGVIDIGGGTTDFLVFHGGVVQHASVLGLGGSHLTNDIAAGLRTPASEAERLKQHFGCALASRVPANDHIEVPGVGGRESRQVSRQVLAEIIEPRTEEILSLVAQDASQARVEGFLSSGVVLVGGTAELPGIVELAERVLGLPVRRGAPREVTGLGEMVGDSSWATGVGLLLLADSEELLSRQEEDVPAGVLTRFRSRMGDWLRDFF